MQADSEVVAAMGVEEGSLSSLPGAVIASSLRLHLGNVGASLPVSSLLSPSAPIPLYMFFFCQLPRTQHDFSDLILLPSPEGLRLGLVPINKNLCLCIY